MMWNIEIQFLSPLKKSSPTVLIRAAHHTRIQNQSGHQGCVKVFSFSKDTNLPTLNNKILDWKAARFKIDLWETVDFTSSSMNK